MAFLSRLLRNYSAPPRAPLSPSSPLVIRSAGNGSSFGISYGGKSSFITQSFRDKKGLQGVLSSSTEIPTESAKESSPERSGVEEPLNPSFAELRGFKRFVESLGVDGSIKSEIKDGVDFLRATLGLSSEEIVSIFRKNPDILEPSAVAELKSLLLLLDLPSKILIVKRAVKFFPSLIVKREAPQMAETLAFFRAMKIEDGTLDKMLVRNPLILVSDVETNLRPKSKYLESLGIPPDKVPGVIKTYGGLMSMSLETGLTPKIKYLKSLGLDNANISKMITRNPLLLGHSVEKKMKPLVAELQKCIGSNDMDAIRRILVSRPMIFCYKLGGTVSQLINNLQKYECNSRDMSYIFRKSFGVKETHSASRYELLLGQYGFTLKQAQWVIGKDPRILSRPQWLVAKKLDNLTKVLGLPAVRCILQSPMYLRCSLKRRILPRQRTLSYLKSKGILKGYLGFRSFVELSNKSFCGLYVKPYPEVEALYQSSSAPSTEEVVPFIKLRPRRTHKGAAEKDTSLATEKGAPSIDQVSSADESSLSDQNTSYESDSCDEDTSNEGISCDEDTSNESISCDEETSDESVFADEYTTTKGLS